MKLHNEHSLGKNYFIQKYNFIFAQKLQFIKKIETIQITDLYRQNVKYMFIIYYDQSQPPSTVIAAFVK